MVRINTVGHPVRLLFHIEYLQVFHNKTPVNKLRVSTVYTGANQNEASLLNMTNPAHQTEGLRNTGLPLIQVYSKAVLRPTAVKWTKVLYKSCHILPFTHTHLHTNGRGCHAGSPAQGVIQHFLYKVTHDISMHSHSHLAYEHFTARAAILCNFKFCNFQKK